MNSPNDPTHPFQTAILRQHDRLLAYLAVIDFISTLARSKNIVIPMEKVLSLVEAKTNDEREDLLFSYKKEIVQNVLNEVFEAEEDWQSTSQPDFNPENSWNSPEWDDGVYAPPPETTDTDITKWEVFNRKWRLFGDTK